MQVAPEAYLLRLQKRQYGLDEQEVYHLHLRPVLVCELDMLIFAPIGQVTCFVVRADRSRDLGCDARLVISNTSCLIVEKRTSQKLDMKFCLFNSRTQILHLRKGE